MSTRTLEDLTAENAELRRRVQLAETAIAELRAEALGRRAEVRSLVAELPAVTSRRALLTAMVRDAVNHPDKSGVVGRAVRKLARAPRKAARLVRDRVRSARADRS